MNLDELRSAQAKERRKDSLQHLRDSFYDEVGAYVADLRAARDRKAEQVSDPFDDDDVRRLSDEVETAEEVAEALYERRVGKVVKLASFAAADMSVDEEGMTTEERALFDDLVDRITENKSTVLDVLAGGSAAGEADVPTADETDAPAADRANTPTIDGTSESVDGLDESAAEPTSNGTLAGAMGGDGPASGAGGEAARGTPEPDRVDAADAAGGSVDGSGGSDAGDDPASRAAVGDGGAAVGGGPGDGAAEPDATGMDATGPSATEPDVTGAATVERATVRITSDVGAIFGVDEREYELASEDVVSLPVANADPLVERDAAERID